MFFFPYKFNITNNLFSNDNGILCDDQNALAHSLCRILTEVASIAGRNLLCLTYRSP